jgi:hypothetical protein
VHLAPGVNGRRLKHALEQRAFELAQPHLPSWCFHRAFIPLAADRLGLANDWECRP